ncbi:ribosomal-protein-alanine acetyltransferase [Sphingosinicella microcystinivorans]|uniref:Ribosomal-protein-alanine N-acetyltransferase n=2 Tax=Sphingosinicella microcystinivorans TaxID=335406 RepID=A0AAD1D448_SPHMI|nr:GNAT family N-acetyltransferase [Sphingosinicella microcystinivorans]RKS89236.1 ribosomal-protein-alanine N-acetyltransferase [Sphingosinicella microcystinivorans]BBE32994.1 ribosomal-protein-alanine acetyltransferase [Sphingosinicella microcystinivorans]
MRHYRPVMIDDVPALAALMSRAFDPQYGEGWNGSQLLGTLAMSGTRAEIAVADGVPVGFALTRLAADDCELLLIAVDPSRSGQGIGTELLKRSIDLAKHAQVRRMFLEVRTGNNAARGLYERYGFICVGQRKDYYVGENHLRFDAMTMSLTL